MIDVETPALAVAEIYREAELRILQRIAAFIKKGIDAPDWATQKLAQTQAVRAMVIRELAAVDAKAAAALEAQIVAAYKAGAAEALRDLKVLPGTIAIQGTQVAAARALAAEITTGIASTRASILGFTEGVIQKTITNALANTLTSALDRRPAAQEALDSLLGRGLTGITTPSGRQMSMTNYVSMATRTGVGNASRQAHSATQLAADLSLMVVEPGPRSCDICDKWARAILSLDGSRGTITVLDYSSGATTDVEIDATIEEAIGDGFEHPNCRCSRRAYIPGITDRSQLDRPEWDKDGYEAQQQQRGIELAIREAKMESALSMSSDRSAEADQRVADLQQSMRDLLAKNEYLKRQSAREQVGRAV
jgi:hypothetical protein